MLVFLNPEDDTSVYKIPNLYKFINGDSQMSFDASLSEKSMIAKWLHNRKNKAIFHQCFNIITRLSRSEIDLSNFPIARVEGIKSIQATLNFPNHILKYEGPTIKQERVKPFTNQTPLNSFDWTYITRAHERLWKIGIGTAAPAETWGPKNWGETKNKEVKLADISHLSENEKSVARCLSEEIMTKRVRRLLSYNEIHDPAAVREYFSFMRWHLNKSNFYSLWRSSC